MQAKAEIDAGVCGFHTTARAASKDTMFVEFEITSNCGKIKGVARALTSKGPINAYEEISPLSESVVMATARECLKGCCAGCIVPVSLFKLMQVAAGLALPRDIAVQITKE